MVCTQPWVLVCFFLVLQIIITGLGMSQKYLKLVIFSCYIYCFVAQLKEIIKILEKLNGNGRWKWLLHYRENKKLKEDER